MKIGIKAIANYIKNLPIKKDDESKIDVELIAERFTLAGLEINDIEYPNKYLDQLRIAKIIGKRVHPNAANLNLLTVKFKDIAGKYQEIEVVCGDGQLNVDDFVPLILLGEILPSTGKKLKPRSISGIESPGMLCSETELCLPETIDGVKKFEANGRDDDEILSADIVDELFPLGPVLDIEITYNRGDLMSLYGLCREVPALGLTDEQIDYNPRKLHNEMIGKIHKGNLDIVIEENTSPYACFAEFNVDDVNWSVDAVLMENSLKIMDQYTGNKLVDITNFITLETGKPIHFFDADKIVGQIRLRKSRKGEKFLALNEKEYDLPEGVIVLSDEKEIISIPGLMGGLNSKVTPETKRVLVESLYLDKGQVMNSVNSTYLHSHASKLFTHGVDPETTLSVFYFIEKYLGCELKNYSIFGNIADDLSRKIDLDCSHAQGLCQELWDENKFIEFMRGLGIKTEKKENIISCIVPSHREDIEDQNVLISEYIRLLGTDKIKEKSLKVQEAVDQDNQTILERNVIRNLASNYHQVTTYKFVGSDHPNASNIFISNPMSGAGAMRKYLLPSLMDVFLNNYKIGNAFAGVFEVSQTFEKKENEDIEQEDWLGVVMSENKMSWPKENLDLSIVQKKALEIINSLNIDEGKVKFKELEEDLYYLDSSYACDLFWKKEKIGRLGLLKLDIKHKIFAYGIEISLTKIRSLKQFGMQPMMKSEQMIIKDFSVSLKEGMIAGDIIDALNKKWADAKFMIFDVYPKNNLSERSLGIRVMCKADVDSQEFRDQIQAEINKLCSTDD